MTKKRIRESSLEHTPLRRDNTRFSASDIRELYGAEGSVGRKHFRRPADGDTRRRAQFAREIHRAERGRYWRPSRLSRGDRVAVMRRQVTRWDV
jgi:hypothetical protein